MRFNYTPGALNINGLNLIREIQLATNYSKQNKKDSSSINKSASSLALAYERARNAVEYRDEHLIRQAAIERIIKRRLFLNQSSDKIATLLIKELTWAKYIEPNYRDIVDKDKFKNIIEKYRDFEDLAGLCACEIDEILNFRPTDQIIINFVSQTLLGLIEIDGVDTKTKELQIYIATERSFAKNSEILIKYKLLKVLLPNWDDKLKLQKKLDEIDEYLNYKHKDQIRRKVNQLSAPFNLIRDLAMEESANLKKLTENEDELKIKLKSILESKYSETKNKVVRASQRSIVYIFLTKMILAIIIEIPFDLLLGKINFLVLSINILFPPSLMILFNSRVRLPESNNTPLMIEKVIEYLYGNNNSKEPIKLDDAKTTTDKVFMAIFGITSFLILIGLIYFLNALSFNFINQTIFIFFLSVVSFFAYRVNEISNDYLLPESKNDSILNTILDYIFLPIIKTGQWLSSQIAKVNILSFIFDFIIEAPLKTFIEILEQWLHFVRIKKEEFLG